MAEQPPQIPSPQYYAQPPQQSAGLAIAALVLGIVAIVLICVPYVSIPCAIVAIVLGVVARKRAAEGTGTGRGMATGGLVCGVISIILTLLLLAIGAAGVAWLSKHPEFQQQLEQQMQQQQRRSMPPGRPGLGAPTPPGSESERSSDGPNALRLDPAAVCIWRT